MARRWASLRVDGGDEIAAVVVADHRCGCCVIEAEPAVLDGIDHPLNRAMLQLVEVLTGHPCGGAY